MSTKIQLADHQKQMVKRSKKFNKGRFQAPTGVGKTFAQAEILRLQLKQGFSVSVVKSPRIGLSNQLAEDYNDYISNVSPKLQYQNLLVHSGDALDFEVDYDASFEEQLESMQNIENSQIYSTTDKKEIKSRVRRAKELNTPIVIFTTYHSNLKVVEVLKSMKISISLDINDEAHYLVREDFAKILDKNYEKGKYYIDPKRRYFFTATEKHTDSNEGLGMNNESLFGKQIYFMSIATAIELKLILQVEPYRVKCHDIVDQKSFDDNIGDVVLHSYTTLLEKYKNIGAKLLVACRGSKQLRIFLESEEYTTLISSNIHVLTVHSTRDLITYNGEIISRKEFDRLKVKLGKDLTTNMIIVHYDILSEGIDIPGLLGVLILRKMKESKFFQTLGRALRVLRINPELKPTGILMFPDVCDADMRESIIELLVYMKNKNYISKEKMDEFLTPGENENQQETNFTEKTTYQSVHADLNLRLYTESLDLSVYSL
jgi:superfamily II DNA or RNA helicase